MSEGAEKRYSDEFIKQQAGHERGSYNNGHFAPPSRTKRRNQAPSAYQKIYGVQYSPRTIRTRFRSSRTQKTRSPPHTPPQTQTCSICHPAQLSKSQRLDSVACGYQFCVSRLFQEKLKVIFQFNSFPTHIHFTTCNPFSSPLPPIFSVSPPSLSTYRAPYYHQRPPFSSTTSLPTYALTSVHGKTVSASSTSPAKDRFTGVGMGWNNSRGVGYWP